MLAIAAGGGLAGAAFAIEIVRGGGRAIVIEKTAGPHHKVCGEFLSANAQVLLKYLGVDCDRAGGHPIGTLLLADRKLQASAPLPFTAVGLSRFRLDELLLSAAQQAGVEVRWSVSVNGIVATDRGVRFETTVGDVIGDVAALSSGKRNVRGFTRPGGAMVGFKMQFKPGPGARSWLARAVQLFAFPGGYGGACLVEDGIMSVAWNIRNEAVQAAGSAWPDQKRYLEGYSQRFAELMLGAEPVYDKPLAVADQPFGFLRSDPLPDTLYAVGDQLAVIPSFTGDGTALALASGIAAARAALRGVPSPAFQRRVIGQHRMQFRVAKALDVAIANRALRVAGLYGARAAPGIVTRLVAATRLRGFEDVLASAPATTAQRSSRDM